MLAEAVFRSPPRLPTDEQTIKDFHLDRATDTNWLLVFEFWRMVFDDFRIAPDAVDEWRRRGALAANLRKVLEENQGRLVGTWTTADGDAHRRHHVYSMFFSRSQELFEGEDEGSDGSRCDVM